jgi:hypothetical protein
MPERGIQTRLIKKVAKSPRVCTNCNNQILIDEVYHLEQGVSEHLHSLIARNFCSKCYAKYGERILLISKK